MHCNNSLNPKSVSGHFRVPGKRRIFVLFRVDQKHGMSGYKRIQNPDIYKRFPLIM